MFSTQASSFSYDVDSLLLFRREWPHWLFVIPRYVKFGDSESALRMLEDMIADGVRPDLVSYSTVLACVSRSRIPEICTDIYNLRQNGSLCWVLVVVVFFLRGDGVLRCSLSPEAQV